MDRHKYHYKKKKKKYGLKLSNMDSVTIIIIYYVIILPLFMLELFIPFYPFYFINWYISCKDITINISILIILLISIIFCHIIYLSLEMLNLKKKKKNFFFYKILTIIIITLIIMLFFLY